MEKIIREFLDAYNIKIKREKNDELNCRCPLPSHTDKKPSFSINKDTGLCNCFGCGFRGNFIHLYASVKEISIIKAIKELNKKYGYNFNNREIRKFNFSNYENRFIFEYDKRLYYLMEMFYEKRVPKYYRERGFDVEDWVLWGGGVDHDRSNLVFPILTNNNILIGIVGKQPYSTGYMMYPNSKISETLYGAHLINNADSVIVTEGIFDTQIVRKYIHHYQDDIDVVGLINIICSNTQYDMLKFWDTIYLLLDNDRIGREQTLELGGLLFSNEKIVRVIPYIDDIKDPNEYDCFSKIIEAYQRSMSFIEYKESLKII